MMGTAKARDEDDRIRVIVRLRPVERFQDNLCIRCISNDSLILDIPREGRQNSFQYDNCCGTECSQDDLFEKSGLRSILDQVLDGQSATIFAYGPTNCGKTFTIAGVPDRILEFGTGEDDDGIVIRSIECLFRKIKDAEPLGAKFVVRASCVEIYNDTIIDLVNCSPDIKSREGLQIKLQSDKRCFFVHDLFYGTCRTEKELVKLYMKTLFNRSVAAHEINQNSSRSHALFTIYVDTFWQDGMEMAPKYGKITFVDLAGSERLKDSHSSGKTLAETKHINRSIFTLGKVIASLCDRKAANIPYRDSKLTQILKDSLGGTSITVMIVCISPAAKHLQESFRALEFADRLKNVRNKPAMILDGQQGMIAALKHELGMLRSENMMLREALLSKDFGGSAAELFPDTVDSSRLDVKMNGSSSLLKNYQEHLQVVKDSNRTSIDRDETFSSKNSKGIRDDNPTLKFPNINVQNFNQKSSSLQPAVENWARSGRDASSVAHCENGSSILQLQRSRLGFREVEGDGRDQQIDRMLLVENKRKDQNRKQIPRPDAVRSRGLGKARDVSSVSNRAAMPRLSVNNAKKFSSGLRELKELSKYSYFDDPESVEIANRSKQNMPSWRKGGEKNFDAITKPHHRLLPGIEIFSGMNRWKSQNTVSVLSKNLGTEKTTNELHDYRHETRYESALKPTSFETQVSSMDEVPFDNAWMEQVNPLHGLDLAEIAGIFHHHRL